MSSRTSSNPTVHFPTAPAVDSLHTSRVSATPATKLPPALTLAWRVWPVADHWTNRWIPLAIVVGLLIVIWAVTGMFWTALLAGAVVLASMWETYFPVHYELGPAGIRIHRFGRQQLRTWQSIRHCRFLRDGLLLLPDQSDTGFDRLRARYIAWNQHGDTVRQIASLYLRETAVS